MINLPLEIEVDGIELSLDTDEKKNKQKEHHGRGGLSDIKWFEYKIANHKEKGIVYDNIKLMPFKITEEIRSNAEKSIIENGVTNKGVIRPHIDYKSGNIHPSKEDVEIMATQGVYQLVLCKGLGPKTLEENGENFYLYKNLPRHQGIRIHKACYYPLIEDDQSLHDDWRYKLLQEVWNKAFTNK